MGKTKIMFAESSVEGLWCVFAEKVLAVHLCVCTQEMCGVTGSLKSNPDYRCSRCKGARPIDGRPHNEWLLMQDKKLDVLIHSATLEIRSVLWLRECYYKNSICMGQVPGTLANINLTCPFIVVCALSCCMPVCWAPNVNDLCVCVDM